MENSNILSTKTLAFIQTHKEIIIDILSVAVSVSVVWLLYRLIPGNGNLDYINSVNITNMVLLVGRLFFNNKYRRLGSTLYCIGILATILVCRLYYFH